MKLFNGVEVDVSQCDTNWMLEQIAILDESYEKDLLRVKIAVCGNR